MAVKDAAQKLNSTLDSLCAVKHHLVEIIAVDGNSSDGTYDLLNERTGCIDFIITQRGLGVYSALNEGIRAASGRYIVLCHAGDQLNPEVVRKLLSVVQESGEVDLIAFDASVPTRNIQYRRSDHPLTINNHRLIHPAIVVRTELYRTHGYYDTRFSISADYEWVARILSTKTEVSIKTVEEPLVFMEPFGMSGSTKNQLRKSLEHIAIKRRYAAPLHTFCYACSRLRFLLKVFAKAWIDRMRGPRS